MFNTIVCCVGLYISAHLNEQKKYIKAFIINLLCSFIVCWSITRLPGGIHHIAHTESTQILTQLQHYKLNLLQSKIQLKEFGSTVPHLYTIFHSPSNYQWYIDIATHTKKYDGTANYFLHNSNFLGKNKNQYIARFQLDNNNLPEIWKWHKFINITEQTSYNSKFGELHNNFKKDYILKRIFDRQDIYARTGIIYRDYNK